MDYKKYFTRIAEQNKMAVEALNLKHTKGIPTARVHILQHEYIERIAGVSPGDYLKDPERVYILCLRNLGSNIHYQHIPFNAVRMGDKGLDIDSDHGAVTSAVKIECDGIVIDSPEAVVEHMEKYYFPMLMDEIKNFDEDKEVEEILKNEWEIQEKIGYNVLKINICKFQQPILMYAKYGYENYLMAYALYPEVMEKQFKLQADLALLKNKAVARARIDGNLPPVCWLSHDMADSRSTLVDIKSLDRIWFPNFARCIEPILKTDIRLIWHCDGNLMEMVPRLLEVGIKGFQGFQYEDGMDYEKICKMKTRDGEDLVIWAGVSVTRTLPFGTTNDVKKELKWLVENGPKTGLFLGASSAVAPGTPWRNIQTLLEGLKYYRENGR